MPFKAIFFDIDGTLVDSNDHHVAAWQKAFETVGARFDPQIVHDQIGKGTDMLVPSLLPDIDEAGQERLGEAHSKAFSESHLQQVRAFPQARDLLARVHAAGKQIVLASSASQSELEHYLDLLDAHDLVSATTTSDDVKQTKPAPDIFATALAKLKTLSPEDVIVVGDTPYDIEAARQCGIAAIGVLSGKFSEATLKDAGAVAVYADVAELLQEFDRSPLAG